MTLRVLVLDDAEDLGGAEQVLLRLAPLLAQRGVDLVLAARPEAALMSRWCECGLEHRWLPLPRSRSLRRETGRLAVAPVLRTLFASGRQVLRTARLAKRARVQVVLGNSHWTHLDAVGGAALARRPAAMFLHDRALPGAGVALRRAIAKAAAISIAVGDGVADQVRPAPVVIVPNGVDEATFHPGAPDPELRASLGASPDTLLVLAIARPDPIKRVDLAVRAVADVPGTHLTILGDWSRGAEACRVRALAEQLLPGRCTFAGQRGDVADCLRAADLLLHPSAGEGAGLAMVEAQACGLPVVAFDVPGVSEVACPTAVPLVAPEAGAPGLSAALQRLVDEPSHRVELGASAAAWAAAHFSLRRQADAVAAVLLEVGSR